MEFAGKHGPRLGDEHIESLQRLERGSPLSDQDLAHLEAVVLPDGLRPAFDIENDSFDPLPATWTELNNRRAAIEPLIKGIGRLNLRGHPSLTYAGTAFVVAEDLLLTNRHVAEFFVAGVGAGSALQFIAGRTASVDLKEEVGSSASVVLDVVAPAVVLQTWDAALLRVAELPSGVRPLPLSASEPPNLDGRIAAVIGYPEMDPASDLIQQIQIFRGVFEKKRLLPGRLMGMKAVPSYGQAVNALAHDCTTLGGNSGSSVIDVATGSVVGLHFEGEYLVANYAVPSWELAKEAQVTGAGVRFV
jgi:endonuclease G